MENLIKNNEPVEKKPEIDSINLEIKFYAPLQNVWKAWTDPDFILRWFGSDPKGEGLSAKLDLRTGGHYEIYFRDSDGTEHGCYGVYKELKELRKLVFSWSWKSEPGVESLVTVMLTPEEDHTFMQFEHARVGYKSVHNYPAGWQGAFNKLEQVLNTYWLESLL